MAFFDSSDYLEVVTKWREEDRHTLLGERWRWRYRVRVEWAIDNTGGESPPTTWSHPDGGTLDIVSGQPQIQYGALAGTYVAIYEGKGSWNY